MTSPKRKGNVPYLGGWVRCYGGETPHKVIALGPEWLTVVATSTKVEVPVDYRDAVPCEPPLDT